jgi:hypothetical protein
MSKSHKFDACGVALGKGSNAKIREIIEILK